MKERLDQKLFEEAYRDYLLDEIETSTKLRESLSFQEQLEFYNWIKTAPFSVLEQRMAGDARKIRQLQSTGRKFLGYWISPISILNAIVPGGGYIAHYFYRKAKDPCYKQCGDIPGCQQKCAVAASEDVIRRMKAAKVECSKTEKADVCKLKLDKQIQKWEAKKLRAAQGKGGNW